MNILILNGNTELNNPAMDMYVQRYQLKLHLMGHYVKTFVLRDLRILEDGAGTENSHSDNTIRHDDDFKFIMNSLADADLVVFATPLHRGHMPSVMSRVQSRIIKYYQSVLQGSVNKPGKYGNYERIPLFGILFQEETMSNQHELLLSKLTQERITTNIHSLLGFFISISMPVSEAVAITVSGCEYQAFPESAFKMPYGYYNN